MSGKIKSQQGYSLLELLIALLILSIVASLTLLSVSANTDQRALRGQVDEFVNHLALFRQLAVVHGRPYQVSISRHHYSFAYWHKSQWHKVSDERYYQPSKPFLYTHLEMAKPSHQQLNAPALTISMFGTMEPFEIRFHRAPNVIAVASDGMGGLSIESQID